MAEKHHLYHPGNLWKLSADKLSFICVKGLLKKEALGLFETSFERGVPQIFSQKQGLGFVESWVVT